MASINVTSFQGKVPKISSKLLKEYQAQTATNCDFKAGNLQPLKSTTSIAQVSNFSVVINSTNNHTNSTIYYIGDIVYYATTDLNYICIQNHTATSGVNYPNDTNGSQYWKEISINVVDNSTTTWVTEISDITCDAASYLASSGAGNYIKYYTQDLNIYIWFNVDSGNSDPKDTDSNLAGDWYGIEVAINSTDTADQVATAISTVLDNYTNTSDYLGLWSAKSLPTTSSVRLTHKYEGSLTDINIGTVSGGLWSVSVNTQGVDGNYVLIGSDINTFYLLNNSWLVWSNNVDIVKSTIPDNNYRIYITGSSYPKQTNYSLATSGSSETWPTTVYRLGVEKPSTPLTASINSSGTIDSDITTAYVYTYVTSWGEEGPPSDPSNEVTITAANGESVDLTGFQYPVKENNNITHIRIYRVNAGDELADYQLVNTSSDIAIATAITTTQNDNVNPSDLGEAITTEDFDNTPDGLTGIIEYGNGIYAAFLNNDLYFNEPFYPYAWPSKYRLNIAEDNIVGIGSNGDGIIVLTDGHPRIIVGSHPANMSEVKLPYKQPCKAKLGIVSSKYGVSFPTPDGLFHISGTSGTNLTENILTRKQWASYDLTNLIGNFYDDKYYGFFKNSNTGFIYDYNNGDYLIDITHPTDTFINSFSTGETLYVVLRNTIGQEYIHSWGTSTTYLDYIWKSKTYQLWEYTNLAVARVIGTGTCTFKLYVDGILKFTKSVTMDKLFKLPSGFRGKEFEIQLEGTSTVDFIQLATSSRNLLNGL